MNQGNGGLLALCGLLGVIAFGVLFVAPRFLEPAAEQTAVEETAAAPETAPLATTSEPSGGDQTGEGRQDRTVTEADAAPEAPVATGQQAAPADQAAATEAPTGEMTQAPAADEPAGEADAAAPDEALETAADASPDGSEPGFDLLRVEPDGSTVIAGRAEPGKRVDVMNGEDVVASADVGPSGDFAAVFDEPLEPGDYQLKLRVTGDDEPQVFSEEIATISIPRDGGSELLAMVTRPGEASRIVNAPTATSEAAPSVGDVAASTTAAPDIADAPEQMTQTADAVSDGGQQEEDAATTAETPVGTAEPAPAGAEEPADVAALAPEPEAAQALEAATAQVRINAVEVEDERLFVAGSSPRGTEVRVYADDQLVGDDRANSEGRFLVEGRMALSVGEHTIRADLIDPSGTVVARALVPFDRPEGGMAAAIAAAEAPSMEEDIAVVTDPSSTAVEAAEDRLAAAAPDAPAEDRLEAAVPDAPAEDRLEATASDAAAGGGETTAPGRTDRLAAAEPEPDMSTSQPPVEAPSGEDMTASGDTSPAISPSGEAETASSGGEAPADTETAAAQPAGEPVTVTQEALTPSSASVIIRRGDTLWQISRRVYGQGVRYTTIYLANQQQITNPDRILPGQIFSVPDEALENSEQLHRDRLQAN